ncbi:putative RNA-directed DNA polymerase [Helianthus anomalus]
MGLDNEFSVIKTQILALKLTPNLGSAYHLVAEDERQRLITTERRSGAETVAFKAHVPGRRDGGHRRDKTGSKERGEAVEHCDFCDRDGHNRNGCFKRIGYPDWWPGNKGKREEAKPKAACVGTDPCPMPGLTKDQYQVLLKHFADNENSTMDSTPRTANMAGKSNHTDDWIIDSGATEHITHEIKTLKIKTGSEGEEPVTIPNGDAIPVKGRGDCTLKEGLELKDVLYVPSFNCNLLSVGRLTENLQCSITFFPQFCIMQKLHSRNLIGAGKQRGRLYRMEMMNDGRKAMSTTSSTWHKRLGHASDEKLNGIDFLKNIPFNKVCDSCSKEKLTRKPFPISTTKTGECFDLIHCDIWGRYRVPSSSGARYFLTIVDDFSRSVWLFLLKFKHEASTSLKFFHKMVKTQFGKDIKKIRCDNGGEFISNDMLQFYKENGILLETTCPHTPQQNGVVERKHRHLLEVARALRFEANLPKRF